MFVQLTDTYSPNIILPVTVPVLLALNVTILVLVLKLTTVVDPGILSLCTVIPSWRPSTDPSFASVTVLEPCEPVAVVEITPNALGGMMWVIAPALSLENAFALNPADRSAILPKLLLLLVTSR